MNDLGFVKVAGSNIELQIASCEANTSKIIEMIDEAISKNIDIIAFPELSITSYTCADLFLQDNLIKNSLQSIIKLKEYSSNKNIVIIVGAPFRYNSNLYNCGFVISNGKILGIVPKIELPNYKEFYEKRWFTSGKNVKDFKVIIDNEEVDFGIDLLFRFNDVVFGVEICEDLWSLNPNSNILISNGANIIFNLSASNEIIGKNEYRKSIVKNQSSKGICAYVYVSSNSSESSTDLLFSGSILIYENGSLLKEGERFSFNNQLVYCDIDIESLNNERLVNTTFEVYNKLKNIPFTLKSNSSDIIDRKYLKTPFISSNENERKERCNEILNIQSTALARRLKAINCKNTVIGMSGGLDSTLAFLVVVNTNKKLNIDNSNIYAITMPGFGTTSRTYDNAVNLVKAYGATLVEIDIKDAVKQHFLDINHDINLHDITYENSQARERTQILMDYANKVNGIVIGTGDLSELALGWCTYNGDHMSMYGVNSSIPKTLVKYLVEFVKDESEVGKEILKDILNTPISPELLPPDSNGNISQITEDTVGPYILHDFFLYHFIRNNFKITKIFNIAKHTFKDEYDEEFIRKWLKIFIRRFFTQQFKRSCMPDGVKVGSVSLSVRGDLKMPSDASFKEWMDEI